MENKVRIGNRSVLLTPKFYAGMQPRNLMFFDKTARLAGLVAIRTDYKASGFFYPWIEVMVKTKGWIAGTVFTDDRLCIRIGMSARFYQ